MQYSTVEMRNVWLRKFDEIPAYLVLSTTFSTSRHAIIHWYVPAEELLELETRNRSVKALIFSLSARCLHTTELPFDASNVFLVKMHF